MICLLTLLTTASADFLSGSELEVSKSCIKYLCNDIDLRFGNFTCGEYFEGNFYMQACPDPANPVCSGPTETEYGYWTCNTAIKAAGSAYPGEACTQNSECITNLCTSGACLGALRTAACTKTSDCQPGLWCAPSLTCQPLLPTSFNCTETSQCILGAVCDQGACTDILSLEDGAKVEKCPETRVNLKCRSATCQNVGGLFTEDLECVAAPESVHSNPYKCSSDAMCSGYQGTVAVPGKCVCGYNAKGQSYCQGHTGDKDSTNFLSALKKFYKTTAAIDFCHSDRRETIGCFLAAGDFDLARDFLYVQYLPYLQDADVDCLKNTVAQYYYHVAFGSITTMIAALLLLN